MAVDLTICPECHRDMVYPTEWEEAGAALWEVTLLCPNCDWCVCGVFAQDVVDRFDDRLDEIAEALVKALQCLEREHMTAEVEWFAEALACDAIMPEDF
jgi:hypothetical protein